MQIQARNPIPTKPDFSGLNTDAFSRLRVSMPRHVFDGQFTYDLQPLLYEQLATAVTAGTSTITHDATNRAALMTLTGAGDTSTCYMQTYQYFPYQPGRSQLIFVTFNFFGAAAGVTKFGGYSDGTNGVRLELSASQGLQLKLYSSTTNSTQTAPQAEWLLDKFNGSGPSKIVFDAGTTQILVIDFQALYVGRVRVGFDIGGDIYWVHEFTHANKVVYPYAATMNLPVQCGMVATAAGASSTMMFICCSVSSEGGDDVPGFNFSTYAPAIGGTAKTIANGARTYIMSIQKKTTFNSITNRAIVNFVSSQLTVTGSNPVIWELCLGVTPTTAVSYTDVNATYSGMQVDISATAFTGTPVVIQSGYLAISGVGASIQRSSQIVPIISRYPLSLDSSGAVRAMGRYTLLLTGVGGTSTAVCSMDWIEQR